MEIIKFDRWKPSADDPQQLEYVGQRTAAEVFSELKHRLEGQGYLPDEYFEMRREWKDGREIPKDADLYCTVDYGASEGVYVDVYLNWYDKSQGTGVTESFIVGKTLGENGSDLDRMFLIASAITKAVHGDHATHARYMKIGGVEEDTGGRVVHLSQQEEKVIIAALVEQRERQEEAMSQTEQLLRRMAGSITAYMDTVGQRPLRLSGYDKTVLAIRDGEFSDFLELYPKVLETHAADMLVEAAGRPGAVGRQMTRALLDDTEQFPEAAYFTACQKAIDINDPQKVSTLLANAGDRVADLAPSFHFCPRHARHHPVQRGSHRPPVIQTDSGDRYDDARAGGGAGDRQQPAGRAALAVRPGGEENQRRDLVQGHAEAARGRVTAQKNQCPPRGCYTLSVDRVSVHGGLPRRYSL